MKDHRFQVKLYPLDQVLAGLAGERQWCPDRFQSPLGIAYYRSLTPINLLIDKYDPQGFAYTYSRHRWNPYYVYEVQLTSPLKEPKADFSKGLQFSSGPNNLRPILLVKEAIPRSRIVSSTLIYDPWVKPPPHASREGRITDPVLLQTIHDYHNVRSTGFRNISPMVMKRFERLHFKERTPIKLYRGLYNVDFLNKIRVGDTIPLSSEKVQSWTLNLCVADVYANFLGARGVIVSAVLDPKDIIIDSRFIEVEQLREHSKDWVKDPNTILFAPGQNEVLTKAGTYKVIVERILYNGTPEPFDGYYPLFSRSRADLTYGWYYDM